MKCGIIVERSKFGTQYGGIAQLARATGSYPVGHGFKSNSRYQQTTKCGFSNPHFVNKARWSSG